jgi:branched-chain amino acid transport system permease protein
VVLGGMGSLSGSVIGAAILAIISTYLQRFPEIRMIIYALILIVIMLLRPQGIMGSKELSLKLFSGITHKKFSTGKRKV